jgi:hypothetical protein
MTKTASVEVDFPPFRANNPQAATVAARYP